MEATADSPIGFYSFGLNGVEVFGFDHDVDDYVLWAWSDDEVRVIHSSIEMLDTDGDGEPRDYFLAGEHRIYLDECIRY